ncbi:MAG TPA: dihydrofolate reductase family protein [Candidatus Bilamarchaeum sp.]|nr:dihydrofolate reductase family protein [Candidatus Bilamarchaeum sp.]
MRKLAILEFMTMDGVIQAPGGPKEDTSGGFKYGGWSFGHGDDVVGEEMGKQMSEPFDLLLGRKTYEIFASYWPTAKNDLEIAEKFNKCTKYVASKTLKKLDWKNSVLLKDAVKEIKKLKEGNGPELQVYGSGNFVQTLLKNDLVDELRLKIYPITLGQGKKLFAEGTIPVAFKLIYSKITPTGVIVATYKREGVVKTGSFE